MIDLGLDLFPFILFQAGYVDFVVEVADVADDGFVFHLHHVIVGDHMVVAGGGDEDVAQRRGLFHGHHPVAFHGRLEGADGIDLGHPDGGTHATQGLGAAFAHVAVAQHHADLAGDHHVGGALDAVEERFAAAVEVVELGLGHRVVDVDGGEGQLAALFHLIKTVDAGGGLLGDALDVLENIGVPVGAFGQTRLDGGVEHLFFFAGGVVEHRWIGLGLGAQVEQQGGVAPVVEDHVGGAAVVPFHDAVGELPVLFQALALVGEHRNSLGGDGGGGVILGGEDVARGPAHFGAQGHQGLDEHRSLDGHVQGTGDACALEGFFGAVFLPQRHQAGHFGLGDGDLLAAPVGQGRIGDDGFVLFFDDGVHVISPKYQVQKK